MNPTVFSQLLNYFKGPSSGSKDNPLVISGTFSITSESGTVTADDIVTAVQIVLAPKKSLD